MDIEQEKAAILRLYETTRRGHLDGDAAKLLAQYAPRWDDLRIRRGRAGWGRAAIRAQWSIIRGGCTESRG